MINWLKERCPVCGKQYEYPEGGYKPSTCNSFDCLHAFIHHLERYKKSQPPSAKAGGLSLPN
jgi:hypothetical protein